MSDSTLNQSEIDALLQGSDDFFGTGGGNAPSGEGFSDEDINAVKELLLQIIDGQSTTLQNLTNRDVVISAPKIEVISRENLVNVIPFPVLEISIPFSEGLMGGNVYIYREDTAQSLGATMMGQEVKELTEMTISAVAEATSQMIGSAVTNISNLFKIQIATGSPQQIVARNFADLVLPSEDTFLFITYTFKLDKLATNFYQIMSLSVGNGIANMKGGARPSASNAIAPEPRPEPMDMGPKTKKAPSNQKNYQMAGFSRLEPVLSSDEAKNISLLLDVEMEVTVELGRAHKTIKEILSMGEGTIISLDRLAGESIDILVNGKPIAKGEVIVIEEYFGIRITEILSKEQRISTLK